MATDDTSSATGPGATELGVDENVAGTLAYLLGLLSGVVLYVVEDNEFVRFHAAQSIVASLGVAVVAVAVGIVASGASADGSLGGVLPTLVRLIGIGVFLVVVSGWLFLMLRAFQGQRYRVPVVARLADSIV